MKNLLQLIQVLQPDIVEIAWDGQDFEIIGVTREPMVASEFLPRTMTRRLMDSIESFLRDSHEAPFRLKENSGA